jgi:uncharacterized membrane protein YeaQ/YmgE (transglycosylase-associated protein family)
MNLTGIIVWLIFGLIAGVIAKFLLPGRDSGGLLTTSILGIVGSLLGGWIGTQLGFGSTTAFDIRGLAVAVLGAIILLIAHRLIRGRNT